MFDELQERVREREEKEAKRRKRLADDFYVFLCTLKVQNTALILPTSSLFHGVCYLIG